MEDEQKTSGEGEEKATEPTEKYETTPIIEKAREEREKGEELVKAQKIENDRAEAILVARELGGNSIAGVQPVKEKEITDKEYAEKALSGELNEKD